ncbi:MAG: helix-turn-helix domain-containing protein [Bacilli bacterium]|nr:helix-turn-helix domain-containing protein [Bacilli bacterium]
MNEMGNMLRVTRESSGVSLEEASNDLNIKQIVLENIEDGKIGAFKDVFQLKTYINDYAKYLGLDGEKLVDSFNEYLFNYTSKIPIKDIKKAAQEQEKDEKGQEKVISPYTKEYKKHSMKFYMTIYIIALLIGVVILAWSIKQITINKRVTGEISYVG